jgi:hypothetical protein
MKAVGSPMKEVYAKKLEEADPSRIDRINATANYLQQ